jgi:hypothetical protein
MMNNFKSFIYCDYKPILCLKYLIVPSASVRVDSTSSAAAYYKTAVTGNRQPVSTVRHIYSEARASRAALVSKVAPYCPEVIDLEAKYRRVSRNSEIWELQKQ